MSFEPSPKQALFLWRMLTAESEEVREPSLTAAKPALHPAKERAPLLSNGFLRAVKRGRSTHLVLTDVAWEWATRPTRIELMKSNSAVGAEALQGLLRRLLPVLNEQGISLVEILGQGPEPPSVTTNTSSVSKQSNGTHPSLFERIRNACLFLAQGRPKQRVRLALLRARLADVDREVLNAELVSMQRSGALVLYRDDNTAALTHDDHDAALIVGDAPRHLVYLEQ